MAKRREQQPTLFEDLVADETAPLTAADVRYLLARVCDTKGHDEHRTETDYGPPWGTRMTWTCRRCGQVRGRAGWEI